MLTAFAPGRSAHEADSALKSASRAETAARQCAVLWFGEILARGLYRELGYSSMPAYARAELGFSETRISDFMRLVQKVKRVKAQAVAKPAVALFAPPADEPALAAEVPVRVTVEFTPEQHARWEALWEQARKRGAAGDRAEVLLEALQSLNLTTSCSGSIPQGKSGPSVHIHVHQCPDCGQVEANGRSLGRADAARVQCDAVVSTPGKRATATIAPRIRREVLARDRHRCQGPGCGRTRFLEIHHKTPRHAGGTNDAANLVTLCAACHRLWHERRAVSAPAPAPSPPASHGGATSPGASPGSRGP